MTPEDSEPPFCADIHSARSESVPMPPYAWRRSHAPDVMAQVVADGRGAWDANVWCSSRRIRSTGVWQKTRRLTLMSEGDAMYTSIGLPQFGVVVILLIIFIVYIKHDWFWP
jgi:hypothetical protein